MNEKRAARIFGIYAAILFIGFVAFWALVIFVIAHFILKYW